VNLTVRVTEISGFDLASQFARSAGPLLNCARCEDLDEIVVAVMQVMPFEQTWALCGPCLRELPKGFHLA
jgi:hypothetical protein